MALLEKKLKRLSKVELLEMLLGQSKRVEELEQQVQELNARLEQRSIAIGNSGNLAEACLQVNGVFEAAQEAADQYMENVRLHCERRTAEAEKDAIKILQKAREEIATQRKFLQEKGGTLYEEKEE
jgi:hypothetical protein